MTLPITPQELAEAVFGVVRDVGASITLSAIAERISREPIAITASFKSLLWTLDALVASKYLERELLPGQRSTYRVHAECPVGPVRLRAAAAVEAPEPPPAKADTPAESKPLAELILEALEPGAPMTPTDISKAIQRKAAPIYKALSVLGKAGRIHKPNKLEARWKIGPDPYASKPAAAPRAEVQLETDADPEPSELPREIPAAPTATAEPPVDYYEALAQARRGELKRDADLQRKAALIDSPETAGFLAGVRNEVAHQIQRWGTMHDRAKAPADWYWLLAYLSGKALAAHIAGDQDKALHHCISSAAVLANWHVHISTGSRFTPGASDLQKFVDERFAA